MTVELDDTPLGFGKYKGRTPNEVADTDPSYIVWMYETVKTKHCSMELYVGCRIDEQEIAADLGLDEAHLLGPKDW